MALYGAPIWVEALNTSNKILLRKPQRVIAVRGIRGYRTVSWTAATLLAGDPPWELQAEVLAEVHRYRAEARCRGEHPTVSEVGRIRKLAQEALIRRWEEELVDPVAGLYLHQIAGREATPACHDCDAALDTARHTLEDCATWDQQRHDLVGVGGNLSLPSVITAMLHSESCWTAMTTFCETVMAAKELAERQREAKASANSLRRRRLGRRRREYANGLLQS